MPRAFALYGLVELIPYWNNTQKQRNNRMSFGKVYTSKVRETVLRFLLKTNSPLSGFSAVNIKSF